MAHNDTQYAWCIHTGEPVHIGDRKEWTSQRTDKQKRAIWDPKDPGAVPEKADRGRSHYCCQDKHISMIVVQGEKNAWCFRPNMLVGVGGDPCWLQEMIKEFQSVGEGKRHKKAKYILANFLNSDTGKVEFSIQKVIVEEKIPGLSLEVKPDIRLEHSDDRPDSYVEIVDTSAPHQNSNAWNFYKDKLNQLITIDIKDNEKGWYYDKESIHKLLVDRFRNRFEDHINTPKIWDDVSAAVTNYEKLRRNQHIKDIEKQEEIPDLEEVLTIARKNFDEWWTVPAIRERFKSKSPIGKTIDIIRLMLKPPFWRISDEMYSIWTELAIKAGKDIGIEGEDMTNFAVDFVNEKKLSWSTSDSRKLQYPKSEEIRNSQEADLISQFVNNANLGRHWRYMVVEKSMQKKIYGSVEEFEESVETLWEMISGMSDELVDEGADKEMLSVGWGLRGDFHPPTIEKKKKKLWKLEEIEVKQVYDLFYRR
mgnify:CR=1 FL=1|jgi:hypothetical protein